MKVIRDRMASSDDLERAAMSYCRRHVSIANKMTSEVF
jgi:hypothetical protein